MADEKRSEFYIVDEEEIAERAVTEFLLYHFEVQLLPSIRKYLEEDEEVDTGEEDEDPEEPAT